LAEDVRVEGKPARDLRAPVADDGTLVFASARAADYQLATVDRSGRRLETLPIAPGKIVQPGMSPDDRKLLFTRAAGGTADIWAYDFASKTVQQVTTDPDYDEAGQWSPDSSQILYQGRREGEFAIAAWERRRRQGAADPVSRSEHRRGRDPARRQIDCRGARGRAGHRADRGSRIRKR
jgi:dipeptidyl aminopeptidase/acylaminoacyl peptidase